MAEAYYPYTNVMPPQQTTASLAGKRPRTEYDATPGQERASYYSHEDNRSSQRPESANQSYSQYLSSGQNPYSGVETVGLHSSGYPTNDPRLSMDPRFVNDPRMGHAPNPGSGRSEVPLPPDASSTIFVEGLPSNCSRREVAHIFRPFVGYKEVRLVTKESRRPGGDPLVLCFVDFLSPPHAATALNTLHGYLFDETDRESATLRLQYARFPGARSGGRRGKR